MYDHIWVEVARIPDAAGNRVSKNVALTDCHGRTTIAMMRVIDHNPKRLGIIVEIIGEGHVHDML